MQSQRIYHLNNSQRHVTHYDGIAKNHAAKCTASHEAASQTHAEAEQTSNSHNNHHRIKLHRATHPRLADKKHFVEEKQHPETQLKHK